MNKPILFVLMYTNLNDTVILLLIDCTNSPNSRILATPLHLSLSLSSNSGCDIFFNLNAYLLKATVMSRFSLLLFNSWDLSSGVHITLCTMWTPPIGEVNTSSGQVLSQRLQRQKNSLAEGGPVSKKIMGRKKCTVPRARNYLRS